MILRGHGRITSDADFWIVLGYVRLFVDAAIAIIVKAIADFEACRGGGTDQADARLAFEHSGTTARQCARQPEAWHVVDLPIAIVIEIVANLG